MVQKQSYFLHEIEILFYQTVMKAICKMLKIFYIEERSIDV